MTDAEWTKHLMSGKRTAYYEALARLKAYHEAGHVVVGYLMGWNVRRVSLQQVNFEPVHVGDPIDAPAKREKARCIAARKRAMNVFAAGIVSATMHQREVEQNGFLSPQEKRAYSTWWEIPASIQVDCDFADVHDRARDAYVLSREAGVICLVKALECIPPNQTILVSPAMIKHEHRVAEIQRAEKRAERILKKHWLTVTDLVNALLRSKTGTLQGKRLQDFLEDNCPSIPLVA